MPDADAEKSVALIGIGLLGTALAERLMQAGYTVSGHDVSPAAMLAFERAGGRPVGNVEDIPAAASAIVLCLPTSDIVADVLANITSRLPPNSVVIDTTTGAPDTTKRMAAELQQANVALVDASILGSSEVTRQGAAVLMVGADADGLAHAEPVLQAISPNIFHIGSVGSGQQMKLVANLVLGLNRAALAEGLQFAKSFGMDLYTVLDVLKSGASYSRVMDAKGQKMIAGDFTPQARLSQHLKDVRLIIDHGTTANQPLPLSETHRQLLETAEAGGCGDLDNSAVIRAWENKA